LLWILPTASLTAQVKRPYLIGISSQHAAIIEHSPKMRHLVGSFPTGMEINLQYQTNGSQPWHQEYQYPRVGLSLIWFDYGNATIGQSLAFSPYISKSFFRSQRQEFNFRMGTGIAFFTNKFNLDDNPDNVVISSSVNAVLQARFEYSRKVADHVSLLAGLGLNHYSNGATRKPNLGVNLPTLSLGLTYHSQPRFTPIMSEQDPFKRGAFVDISTSVGVKSLSHLEVERYLVNSITVAGGYRANRKSNLLLGVEGFYDRSLHKVQSTDYSLDPHEPKPDVRRVGVYAGHELIFGNFSFQTHLGVYVYKPYKFHPFYYQRLGLKYQFAKTLFGGLDLKVHGGQADVIECRMGVRL
jgi:hypothetical protein